MLRIASACSLLSFQGTRNQQSSLQQQLECREARARKKRRLAKKLEKFLGHRSPTMIQAHSSSDLVKDQQ